jgi:spore maturation protein CgeB
MATDGHAIVEHAGRPLESRRAPADAATRQALAVSAEAVILVGLGAGYLLESLIASGRRVVAVVESEPDALAAAFVARDLTASLDKVPVILAETLRDPVERVILKACASAVVPLGPRVAADRDLSELVAAWPAVPAPGRCPRVLVIGPTTGEATASAASTSRAIEALGVETAFLDLSPFGFGRTSLAGLGLPTGEVRSLDSGLRQWLGQVALRKVAAFKPDLVLAMTDAPVTAAELDAMRRAGIRTACWFLACARDRAEWREIAPGCDTLFTIQQGQFEEDARRAGANVVRYLPAACDPTVHQPITPTANEGARWGSPLAFVGDACLNRRRILASVADLSLKIFGAGWQGSELDGSAVPGSQTLTDHERVLIASASAINLNVHAAGHVEGLDPDPDHIDPRTFELAGCGAFQIVDARHPLRSAFGEDEVPAFASPADLRALIERFLAQPQERAAYAHRAREHALHAHTFAHRARALLTATLPPDAVAAALMGHSAESLEDAVARLARDNSMGSEEALLRILMHLERLS